MQASSANTMAADIVLSTKYTIQYHKNYDGEVANVPKSTPKYWYENAEIAGEIPSEGRIKFLGWSENAGADKPDYQPGDPLNASLNRNISCMPCGEPKSRLYITETAVMRQKKGRKK